MYFILLPNPYYQVVRALISFPSLMNVKLQEVGKKEMISIPHLMILWDTETLQSDNAQTVHLITQTLNKSCSSLFYVDFVSKNNS